MKSALVITAGERAGAQVRSLLEQAEIHDVRYAASFEAARAQFDLKELAVVVVTAPLPGGSLDGLATEAAQRTQAGVVMIVSEWQDGAKAEEAGALLVKKPASQTSFLQAVRHAQAVHRRMVRLSSENRRLHVRLDEVRMISRAKLLLINRFAMTEEQAHHYLERQAMQQRISLEEAAKNVVANCEM